MLASLRTVSSALLTLCLSTGIANAWEPRPGWTDSYAVGGICYCDSTNFDHGIGKIKQLASDGYQRTVEQICADIKTKFGVGALEGRIPYNTIACGNAPANDAPDEDLKTGCPGRVDRGDAGCFDIGPEWPLDRIYGAPIEALDRSDWQITASDNQKNTSAMTDGQSKSRWSTNKLQSPGQWIEVDLGSLYKVNVIDLESIDSRHDYPAGWTLQVSADKKHWAEVASHSATVEQPLQQGEITRLLFPEIQTQYLRITQTGSSKQYYWSVHELFIGYLSVK